MLTAELRTVSGDWTPDAIDVRRWCPSSVLENSKVYYNVVTDYYHSWHQEITGAKLCGRGWVFQERLLAPRVLHFAKRQLWWECVEQVKL